MANGIFVFKEEEGFSLGCRNHHSHDPTATAALIHVTVLETQVVDTEMKENCPTSSFYTLTLQV